LAKDFQVELMMAMILDVIGGSSHHWHSKQNVFHHTYVNITGRCWTLKGMTMVKQFETDRYDLVKADRVCVANHRFGRNRQGELDVWIERSTKGERFLSQLIVQGETYSVRKEVYTRKCYILREKATGRYWFLDINDCGFWLHTTSFAGAETFFGDASVKIEKWLNDFADV
jgi:hypothetical protein